MKKLLFILLAGMLIVASCSTPESLVKSNYNFTSMSAQDDHEFIVQLPDSSAYELAVQCIWTQISTTDSITGFFIIDKSYNGVLFGVPEKINIPVRYGTSIVEGIMLRNADAVRVSYYHGNIPGGQIGVSFRLLPSK